MSKALQNAFKDFIATNLKEETNHIEEGDDDQNEKNFNVPEARIPESPGIS